MQLSAFIILLSLYDLRNYTSNVVLPIMLT